MKGRDAAMAQGVPLVLRILLVIVGGYLLAAGGAGLSAATLSFVMPRSEAVVLMAMLAFVVYLVLLLWGFAEQRPARLWAVFGAGGATAYALAETIGALGGV